MLLNFRYIPLFSNITLTDYMCEDGFVYDVCGSSCHTHCWEFGLSEKDQSCDITCKEGCFCPKGTYMQEGNQLFY